MQKSSWEGVKKREVAVLVRVKVKRGEGEREGMGEGEEEVADGFEGTFEEEEGSVMGGM